MLDDSCIFCKIIKGDIPSNTIYEDEDFKVILDVGPVAKGHALIIPKDHYQDFYELPEELAVKAIKIAKEQMVKITEALKCDGFNVLQNNKEIAGQTVLHYHMHLIPRYEGGQELFAYTPLKFSPEEMSQIKNQIVG